MSSKTVQNEGGISLRRAKHWSISRRLIVLYAAASLLMLLVATAYLYWSLVENVVRDDNAFLANKIQECRRLLRERPQDNQILANEVQVEAAASQFIKYYVRVLESQERVALETPGMTELLPVATFPPAVDTTDIPTRGTVWKSATGESYLLMAARAQNDAETTASRMLHVALNVSADEALLAGYRWKLLAVVLLGLLFSCASGALITRKGLRPLEDIAHTTERVSASQLHERIVPNGWPDELTSLARSFDRMLDRLEDSFKRLSQFSADLAHELRTPINNLRGEAGVALSQSRTAQEYRHTLESSLEEYARLARLIDNLLFLARADSATPSINRAPCDARQAIDVVREYYEAIAADRGVEVCCEGEGTVDADPVLFRQAISNLLANALNHTPSGGRVEIRVRQREDRDLQIVVSDTGCGIPAQHLPRIFDRLYRGELARSQHPDGAGGSGLGLAIVKSIMTLHGGSVEVQSEFGKGTRFTLLFPSVSPTHKPS